MTCLLLPIDVTVSGYISIDVYYIAVLALVFRSSEIFAGEKEAKPISGRVKEIAEFMLSCVMEKIVSKGLLLAVHVCSRARLRLKAKYCTRSNRRSRWRVAVTGASRARSGGGFETGIPGGRCSMLSGRPH